MKNRKRERWTGRTLNSHHLSTEKDEGGGVFWECLTDMRRGSLGTLLYVHSQIAYTAPLVFFRNHPKYPLCSNIYKEKTDEDKRVKINFVVFSPVNMKFLLVK